MNNKTVPAISREYITTAAIKMRKAAQYENEMVFPIVKFIEQLIDCMNGSLEIVEDNELLHNRSAETKIYNIDNADNKTWPWHIVIKIKESVYYGALAGEPEDRFTLAHEIGHAFLLHGCYNLYRNDKPKNSKEDPEWQADIFAINLLAPIYFFNGTNHNEIAECCKVPLKYAILQNDFIITDGFFDEVISSTRNIHFSTKDCAESIIQESLFNNYS